MASASALVTLAGWLAIAAGAAVALLGLVLFGSMFSGGGAPVSGAGLFVILTLGAGPVLILTGIAMIVSGFKLMGGHAWARTVLEVIAWTSMCASAGWVIYNASQQDHIYRYHVIQGAMFLLGVTVPAIVLIALLRSDAIQRAMIR